MTDLTEMIKWNYKETKNFFDTRAIGTDIPETKIYIDSLIGSSQTVDIRSKNEHHELTQELTSTQCFIIIDGPSNSGKSTFARRLANAINAEIVDIDLLCYDYLQNRINQCKNYMEVLMAYHNIDQETDEFILNNLEDIIAEKAKKSKTVILVGMYLEPIYRCILARTLGKYFKRTVSLFCLEYCFGEIQKMQRSRANEFGGKTMPGEIEKLHRQYMLAKEFASMEDGKILAAGVDSSYLVNTTVSNWYSK